jgi:hypothetical protein
MTFLDKIGRRSFVKSSLAVSAAAVNLHPTASGAAVTMPAGRIGKVEISRLICGSNPFYGGAHSRDLKYVGKLLKAYCTEEKILDTLELCEQSGINTIIEAESLAVTYRRKRGGHLQGLAMIMLPNQDIASGKGLIEKAKKAVDDGVVGAFIRGCEADRWVQANKLDLIENFLTFVRKNGLIAGIGAHDVQVPITCEQAGLKPDFHFKTFHHGNYYSALPREKRRPFLVDSWGPDDHDCIWEQYPERTIEFMKTVRTPWIGFKVLAAGAIPPKEGFKYAFQNGADFLAVGMLDLFVQENVEAVRQVLSDTEIQNRTRPWA